MTSDNRSQEFTHGEGGGGGGGQERYHHHRAKKNKKTFFFLSSPFKHFQINLQLKNIFSLHQWNYCQAFTKKQTSHK